MSGASAGELRWRNGWWLAGWLLLLATIISCLMPSPPVNLGGGLDKVYHFVAFVALGSWFGALAARRAMMVVALVALGGAIEIAQSLLNMGRGAAWGDLAADALGVLVGASLGFRAARYAMKHFEMRFAGG